MKLGPVRLWRDWEFQLNLERHNSHDEVLQEHEDRLDEYLERLEALE